MRINPPGPTMGKHTDSPLAEYEVLMCVTGGIAAYKSADLVSKLVQSGAGVTVAMSDAGRQFVTPLTFQALSGRRVYLSLWQPAGDYTSQHISLTEAADLMIIAPATADIIAKTACGIADDLVSTMALSSHGACPLLIAPAMNERMWSAPATKANVKTLSDRGTEFVGPAEGRLACGTVGPGRMAEPLEILSAASKLLLTQKPKKKT